MTYIRSIPILYCSPSAFIAHQGGTVGLEPWCEARTVLFWTPWAVWAAWSPGARTRWCSTGCVGVLPPGLKIAAVGDATTHFSECVELHILHHAGVPNKIHHSGSRLGRGTMKQLFVLYSSHRNRIMIPNHFRIFFTGLDRQDVKQKRNWASIWRLNFAIGAAAGENGGPATSSCYLRPTWGLLATNSARVHWEVLEAVWGVV